MTDVNFPQDFYLDDVGVWRLKKEKLAELEKPKPMTNEEYLKSLDTEQLAEWITDIVYECKDQDDCMDCKLGWCSGNYVAKWLKQPHT